jgi:hypothetical protein
MSEAQSKEPAVARWVSAWISVLLAGSAVALVGNWLMRATQADDTEALESPLMLSMARQLVAGPSSLYGPFGGQNPLVLIHAPLYYRLGGLLAWPLFAGGVDAVTAARVAGRSLSILGLAAVLAAALRLARLDGEGRRAGWWAVLLIASTPVVAGQAFAVRPDLVGVALQTFGVLRVLAVVRQEGSRGGLLSAYAAFGLAVCVKQHLVAAPLLSTGVLLVAWRHGRVALREIERALLLGAVIVATVYLLEALVTGGRIWQAAFVAASQVGRVHPGGWGHLSNVLVGVLMRSAGLAGVLVGAAVVMVASRSGWLRVLVGFLGTAVISVVVAALLLHPVVYTNLPGAVAVLGTAGALAIVFPICAIFEGRLVLGNWVDKSLWAYVVAEASLAAVLVYSSVGAWSNYAIQALVFGGILAARAASRAMQAALGGWQLFPLALALLGIAAGTFDDLFDASLQIRTERTVVDLIFEHTRLPPSAFFFTDRPGFNRIDGRLDLVFDQWLYPVFEQLGLAESRSRWLATAIRYGPVRAVVNTSDHARIDGIDVSLLDLGYHPDVRTGPFYVWTR